jgi:hypothetical protein
MATRWDDLAAKADNWSPTNRRNPAITDKFFNEAPATEK